MPEGDEDFGFVPDDADIGFVADEPAGEGTSAIPEGYREQGRRELVLGETTVTGGRGGGVSYDPSGEHEVREIEKDPAHLARRQTASTRGVTIDPETGERSEYQPQRYETAGQRLYAYLSGQDPDALGEAGEVTAGEALGPVLRADSLGGVEMPSLASARRALSVAGDAYDRRVRGGRTDFVGAAREAAPDALSALFPTAERPEGMRDSAPDLRSQAGYRNALGLFGWADELADLREPGTGAQMRALREMSSEQAPGQAALGGVAESIPLLAIPGGQSTALGRIGAATGVGLGIGTLRGAGESEADDVGGVLEDAVRGGVQEGATAGALTGVGEAASPVLRRLGDWATRAARSADDAAVQSRLEATGVWGGRAMRAADEMPGGQPALAADLRRLGIGGGLGQPGSTGPASRFPRPERALEDAGEVIDAAGQRMRAVIDAMDDAARASAPAREAGAGANAPGFVDVTRVADEMEAIARQYESLPVGGQQVADALRTRIIEPLRARPAMTFGEAHQQRRLLDDLIRSWRANPDLTTASGQLQTARRALARAMDDAAANLDPALRDAWRQANRDYSVGAFIGENGRGAERLSVGGGIGGAVATGVELAQQGVPGSGVASGIVGRELAQQQRMRWPGIRAVGLEGLAARLRAMGPRAQAWADALEGAQRRGNVALAAAHAMLQRTDPAYRQAVADLETEGEE